MRRTVSIGDFWRRMLPRCPAVSYRLNTSGTSPRCSTEPSPGPKCSDSASPRDYIAGQVNGQRWRRVRPGVYFTFTGPASFAAHVWAGVLYGGDGAVASGETAAFLCGLTDRAPSYIEISVVARRRVDDQRGHDDIPSLRVRRVVHLSRRRHPSRSPPQTRIEDTVLDLIDRAASADRVVSLITGSCQILDDVRDGVQSPLERRWRKDWSGHTACHPVSATTPNTYAVRAFTATCTT